jgi:hypothetical protein
VTACIGKCTPQDQAGGIQVRVHTAPRKPSLAIAASISGITAITTGTVRVRRRSKAQSKFCRLNASPVVRPVSSHLLALCNREFFFADQAILISIDASKGVG